MDEPEFLKIDSIYRDACSLSSPLSHPHSFVLSINSTGALVINKLENYYCSYVSHLNNASDFKIKDIQTSFEDYFRLAGRIINDPSFMKHVPHSLFSNSSDQCPQQWSQNETTSIFDLHTVKNCVSPSDAKLSYRNYLPEVDKGMILGKLKTDFYAYYVLLNKIWSSEYIRKSDVNHLQPCKVLLLRSIIKRKFGKELALKWTY